MAGSTVLDFLIARAIYRCGDQPRRRALLVVSLIVNFTILGVFKYFNFFGSVAEFVGKRAVEKAAAWKSPPAGLSPSA
jgi:hypothetical protein